MKHRSLFFVGLGIVIFLVVFFLMRPSRNFQPVNTKNQTVPDFTKTTENNTPTPNIFNLSIKNQKIASGSSEITVLQGETVTLKITSDEAEELHLHGYDKSINLKPNQEVELIFEANTSGRFPFELEQSGISLGNIVVAPQ